MKGRRKNRAYRTGAAIHALARAEERYDALLSGSDLDQIGAMFRRGEYVKLLKKSGTRRVAIIEFKGRQWRVVYSRTIKAVITFLPHESKTVEAEAEPPESVKV